MRLVHAHCSGIRFLKALLVSFATYAVLSTPTATAQTVVATSTGGIRDWEDPTAWSFDQLPNTATIPNNDAVNLFDVRIDGGSSTATEVSLSTAVAVDRVEIAAGDSLFIEGSADLAIVSDLSRPGSGQLVNDGTVLIDGATSTARLNTGGGLSMSISGAGTLRMTGGAELGMLTSSASVITNHAGHQIEGSGTIFQDLTNDGTVLANSDEALRLGGRLVQQRGLLEATGAGGLEIRTLRGIENTGTLRASGSSIVVTSMTNDGTVEVTQGGRFSLVFPTSSVTNNGLIEITQGGEFVHTMRIVNESTGHIVVSGAGSRLAAAPLSNGGTLEVLDGGHADFSGSLESGVTGLNARGTVRIGDRSIIDGGSFVRVPGLLDLDGGTIRSGSAGMTVNGDGRIEGSGRIELGRGELGFDFLGKLVPGGTDGIGTFDVVGDVDVSNPRSFGRPQIEIELGGTAQGEYDVISIEGTLSLMGSVLVDLINLDDPADPAGVFDPSAGSIFDIFIASNIVDLGGTFTLPTFDDGREFTQNVVRVGAMDVLRLVVIPEPTTAMLLTGGLMALALTERRQPPIA